MKYPPCFLLQFSVNQQTAYILIAIKPYSSMSDVVQVYKENHKVLPAGLP